MGLDLYPIAKPKPGHEAAWEKLVQSVYAGKEWSEKTLKRFGKISIEAWASVGAPRVGYDKKADRWALKHWRRKKGVSDSALLKKLRGHYALPLLRGKCDGIPKYSNAATGLVDETSFRGEFLRYCKDACRKSLLDEAWVTMPPEKAVDYGKRLLESAKLAPKRRKKKPRRTKQKPLLSFTQQIDVLRAAGRWYIFWGERGHPIAAWF